MRSRQKKDSETESIGIAKTGGGRAVRRKDLKGEVALLA